MKYHFYNALLLSISTIVTLVLVELICRVYFFGGLTFDKPSEEAQFWQYHEAQGWLAVPGIRSVFANPLEGFSGKVSFNELGVRNNDNDELISAEAREYKHLLLVGDSTTAGLEVDNHETYAAVLERKLNAAGCHYRVHNAGVRGYGTDQALWQLQRLHPELNPDAVMYLFTGNDLLNNRTIKRAQRKYSKPALVLKASGDIEQHNYPAQKFEKSYYAYAHYQANEHRLKKGHLHQNHGLLGNIKSFIKNNLALYYPLKALYYHWGDQALENLENSPLVAADYQLLAHIIAQMKQVNPRLFISAFAIHQEDTEYRDPLKAISAKLDLEYLDIAPAFDKPEQHYHWKQDPHWNQNGHQNAAEALYEQLAPRLCGA